LNRRTGLWCGLSSLVLGLALLAGQGCDYSATIPVDGTGGRYTAPISPVRTGKANRVSSSPKKARVEARENQERKAILDSAITLIQRSALQPGGDNFRLAVQKLNQYFEGTEPAEYLMGSASRAYLGGQQIPPTILTKLENSVWDDARDTRHIEDCMMYYGIATRVAGTGESLDRVRRIFDWVVRQVQLVPAGTLGAGRLGQAIARPYDVLLRGMATESEGLWAERAWLFMALCRQLGIDSGLLVYTKGNSVEPLVSKGGGTIDRDGLSPDGRRRPKAPVIWICAVLIDERAYLFDARVGLEIPSPDGEGVATLADALSDPSILDRMEVPGQAPYFTSRASLLASPTKIGVLIDSSSGYFAPRMRLLERELSGKNRTILFRDPAEQRDHFARVLAPHNGAVTLWRLPMEVEIRLFTDPQFVQSIQNSLYFFRPEFPLLYARIKQLRGELDEAVEDYVKFRFGENLPQVNAKKKGLLIDKTNQAALDVYATYYLGLAQLERNNLDQAELMFRMTLEMLPEPGPNQPYYNMFRWGAGANLGRILEARRDRRGAVGYYTQADPTFQYVGNLLRARDLIWDNPMEPCPDPLPHAPGPK
jgi:hypothetical protein